MRVRQTREIIPHHIHTNRKLTFERETLQMLRNAFFALDFGLDVFDGIRRLDLQRNRLSRFQRDENLHTTAQTQNQVKSRFLLNIVVAQRTAILELFA